MSKENTFYFSHDYNTRSDMKIQRLITKKGYLGYGLFWALIENLYNNANALPLEYDVIAFDLRTDEDTIKCLINDFDLFIIKDGYFGSNSVQRRLDERNLKSEKARESALNRWKKPKEDASALPTQSDSNAIKESKVKESKVKESKDEEEIELEKEVKELFLLEKETKEENLSKENPNENFPISESVEPGAEERKKVAPKKERFKPPTVQEVQDYCNERQNGIQAYTFVNFYQSKGWKVGNQPMKDWKAAIRTWEQKNKQNGITKTTNAGFSTSKPSTNNGNSGKRSYRQILAERLTNELKANGEGSNITIDAEICE